MPPNLNQTPSSAKSGRWRLSPREARMLLYLAVFLSLVTWKFIPRPWSPSLTLDTTHHSIPSTATQEQTERTAQALELLYYAYSNRFQSLPGWQVTHSKMRVKLFKDRAEFRRINPGLGWAEAFYRKPYCRAYFAADESNPYHWMLHESVHQLNEEVAQLKLAKWLDEGLADYFATSQLNSNALAVGLIDPETYPVWWLDEIATEFGLAENIRNGSVIPLRSIITNRGGPSLNRHFNLYYLHWWTLTLFVFESPQHRDRAPALLEQGGGVEAFERLIGPVEQVQVEWHAYVRQLKGTLAANPQLR